MPKTLFLFICFLLIPMLAAQAADEIFLLFPDVIHTVNLQTGLAFANPSTTPASLTLYFIDDSGHLLQGTNIRNRVSLEIEPGSQKSHLLPDIFGSGIMGISGFVFAETSNVGVVGFFLIFDPAIGKIDGADAWVTPLVRDGFHFRFSGGLHSALIFPEIVAEPGSSNRISILSLAPGPYLRGMGTLELIRDGQVIEARQIDFPATDFLFARFSGELAEIFATPLRSTDFVRASSIRPLLGYQSFGQSRFTAGQNAFAEPRRSRPQDTASFGAQLALTPEIDTFLKAVNPTSEDMNLTVEAFSVNGSSEESGEPPSSALREISLPPRSAIHEDLSEFLSLSNFRGWLRIRSDRTGLIATTSFGDREGNFFSSVPAQTSPQRQFVNSHLANGSGFGTGITFLNPSTGEVEVQVDVFNRSGTYTGGGSFSLAAFEHSPMLLSDIDPQLQAQEGGFIKIEASGAIFSFELFYFIAAGTRSIRSMSAVPPQRGNGFVQGTLTAVDVEKLGLRRPAPPHPRSGRAPSEEHGVYPASRRRGVSLDTDWEFLPGQVIVKLRDRSIGSAPAAAVFGSLPLQVLREVPERTFLLRSEDLASAPVPQNDFEVVSSSPELKSATLDLIERLNSLPDVEYAEPNYLVHPSGTMIPADPLYEDQWSLPFISLTQAWRITTGDPNLVVAVIDTGAKFAQPDLAGRLTGGQFDFISDPQMSADGDGIDGDAEDSGDAPDFPSFHGTHVAGIIGSVTNNGTGVAGGNWNSRLMTLRALGVGGGTTFDVMQAARFAAGLPNVSGRVPAVRASVINMSLGSSRPCSLFERENFAQISAQGVSVVAAAGNSDSAEDFSPAACPGIISVGALGPNGRRAPYSNFGPHLTGLAPGGDFSIISSGGILSTWWNKFENAPTFVQFAGTSMAAPQVAAIVSLMKSVNPTLAPEAVKQILQETALDLLAPGRDELTGFGRFDAFRAVRAASGSVSPGPVLSVDTVLLDFTTVTESLPIALTNIGDGLLTVESITVETDSAGNWLSLEQEAPEISLEGDSSQSLVVLADRSGLPDGEYLGRLRIQSNGGGLEIKIRVAVGPPPIIDVGKLFVVAVDPRTQQSVAGSSTTAADGYSYRFQVAAGDYVLLASTDADRDGLLCEEEDLCGRFPIDNDPVPVRIRVGETVLGINFPVRPRALMKAAEPGGIVVPEPILRNLNAEFRPD